jgi:cobalt-zinc-cadmium efflux system membrane fusion protein
MQVLAPYSGRLVGIFARLGDAVPDGQALFTLDSPDLLSAENTLIAADAQLTLTNRNLARARELIGQRAITPRDLDQAVNDQQAAEGALRVARDALRIFGKTPDEIDRAVQTRRTDSLLVVRSPVAGTVVARVAQPGL